MIYSISSIDLMNRFSTLVNIKRYTGLSITKAKLLKYRIDDFWYVEEHLALKINWLLNVEGYPILPIRTIIKVKGGGYILCDI